MAALFTLVAGRLPAPGAQEVMIESALAERRGWKLGDAVHFFRRKEPLAIVGLFARNPDVTTADAYAPLPVVQQLRECEGEISFSLLEVAPGRSPGSVAPAVSHIFPDSRVLTLAAARARADAAGAPVRLVARSLSSVVAALCATVILLTLWSTVSERRTDYAVLRAMGFGSQAILLEVLCQALLLGAAGIVMGTALGQGILVGMIASIHPGIEVAPDFRAMALLAGAMMVVVFGGAILPGLRAARAEPDSLMGPPP
jgi:predicted lysophospholipase L1 biosynthesis ABC-type transport system permease subunit